MRKDRRKTARLCWLLPLGIAWASPALAQPGAPQAQVSGAQGAAGEAEKADTLRKAAQNPIASLISVPFQWNSNFNIGPYDRTQSLLNIQPVVPVKVQESWNLIMRFITPVLSQPDTTAPEKGTFGLGDMNPTFFLSPAKAGKLIWGFGPAFVLPTATDPSLGQGKLSIGPSFVGLVQPKKWTLGVLASNVWSVAGKADRPEVNQFLLQYFINYNMAKGYYVTLQPIVTSNWRAEEGEKWTVPFGGGLGRVFKLGPQPVNINFQAYYTPVRPTGASSFTIRAQYTMLYPKS